MSRTFRAYRIFEAADGKFERKIVERKTDDLPAGDVLIQVHYAGLNYKDGLSSSGHKGITKEFPHTPGLDASGVVVESNVPQFHTGDRVLVTGYDMGMNTDGGFGEYIRVPAGWVVPLPSAFNLRQAMIVGTAGFTASLALYKMEMAGQQPKMGELVVTGATGGVGSMAVAIFSKAGYDVVASTGKSEEYEYLKKLGAVRCEGREYCNDEKKRPISRSKWAGGLDTVGGNTLATLMAGCGKNGSIGVCGLVESPKLETTVYPFLLNGVNLIGVESAETPMETRLIIWDKLSTIWKPDNLEDMAIDTTLDQLDGYVVKILAGKTRGRVVVKHQH
ncbi:MAG: oxidoreductase [Crocinitomicaceae bacterium]|nr:oxidoreductase [Crocinitomicaceae bacterium]|tara:strand:- start:16185 stop:17183 length:999 start_codon:yes stop_codon:yes gene_type:complete